ncbi:uncharacterized protein LOC135384952 [Ornithodoros turicata]|uniref:uncharacterized protein LOC135384952 n=1 Tax=Ornithodoros turicata TaxID=34597 RepID=UPI003139EF74
MVGVLGAGQQEVRCVRNHFANIAEGRDLPPHHALDRRRVCQVEAQSVEECLLWPLETSWWGELDRRVDRAKEVVETGGCSNEAPRLLGGPAADLDAASRRVLRGLNFAFAYLDDILVASSSPEEHLDRLRLLFLRLHEYGVVINAAKCEFGVQSLTFIGHTITPYGIRPFHTKVEALMDCP